MRRRRNPDGLYDLTNFGRYDRRNDPRELHNVAAEHPQIVDHLWHVLEDEAGAPSRNSAPRAPRP